MKSFSLAGKVAIITGSTRGIGKAIAHAFVEAGAKVVISSRNQATCDEVANELNAEFGEGRALAVAASISSKADLERLVVAAREQLGSIDVLVCNAASNPHFGPSTTLTDEQFRKVFENNVLSHHWLTQLVAPDMIARKDGVIILVSSIGGMMGSAEIGAYNVSKAADFQMVRNLAVEFGKHNIRVNAIAPGVTRTDFARAIWEDPKAEAAISRATPIGRIGEPEDMAGVALLLASPAGSYITGQAIVVDGGVTISGGY